MGKWKGKERNRGHGDGVKEKMGDRSMLSYFYFAK
jgi:hypothetical protein